ncbi:unnamed protein product [Amoebophrya sp. A120]|nr:unnamed protein product [Amoebophrya sp. A120]|eukprot:GSA120T00004693001.1
MVCSRTTSSSQVENKSGTTSATTLSEVEQLVEEKLSTFRAAQEEHLLQQVRRESAAERAEREEEVARHADQLHPSVEKNFYLTTDQVTELCDSKLQHYMTSSCFEEKVSTLAQTQEEQVQQQQAAFEEQIVTKMENYDQQIDLNKQWCTEIIDEQTLFVNKKFTEVLDICKNESAELKSDLYLELDCCKKDLLHLEEKTLLWDDRFNGAEARAKQESEKQRKETEAALELRLEETVNTKVNDLKEKLGTKLKQHLQNGEERCNGMETRCDLVETQCGSFVQQLRDFDLKISNLSEELELAKTTHNSSFAGTKKPFPEQDFSSEEDQAEKIKRQAAAVEENAAAIETLRTKVSTIEKEKVQNEQHFADLLEGEKHERAKQIKDMEEKQASREGQYARQSDFEELSTVLANEARQREALLEEERNQRENETKEMKLKIATKVKAIEQKMSDMAEKITTTATTAAERRSTEDERLAAQLRSETESGLEKIRAEQDSRLAKAKNETEEKLSQLQTKLKAYVKEQLSSSTSGSATTTPHAALQSATGGISTASSSSSAGSCAQPALGQHDLLQQIDHSERRLESQITTALQKRIEQQLLPSQEEKILENVKTVIQKSQDLLQEELKDEFREELKESCELLAEDLSDQFQKMEDEYADKMEQLASRLEEARKELAAANQHGSSCTAPVDKGTNISRGEVVHDDVASLSEMNNSKTWIQAEVQQCLKQVSLQDLDFETKIEQHVLSTLEQNLEQKLLTKLDDILTEKMEQGFDQLVSKFELDKIAAAAAAASSSKNTQNKLDGLVESGGADVDAVERVQAAEKLKQEERLTELSKQLEEKMEEKMQYLREWVVENGVGGSANGRGPTTSQQLSSSTSSPTTAATSSPSRDKEYLKDLWESMGQLASRLTDMQLVLDTYLPKNANNSIKQLSCNSPSDAVLESPVIRTAAGGGMSKSTGKKPNYRNGCAGGVAGGESGQPLLENRDGISRDRGVKKLMTATSRLYHPGTMRGNVS